MKQPSNGSDSTSKPPLCPQCGLPLERKGRIVDAGKFKKWIDEWHCATHGQVEVPEKPLK